MLLFILYIVTQDWLVPIVGHFFHVCHIFGGLLKKKIFRVIFEPEKQVRQTIGKHQSFGF